MHYLVYQITNITNGKTYIGCHKTLVKDDGYMGSGKILKLAIKKHGIDNFRKDILFEASTSEEMFTKEKELVVLGPKSYNMRLGGDGGFDHIHSNLDLNELGKSGYENGLKLFSKEKRQLIGSNSGTNSVKSKIGLFDPKYDEKRRHWTFTAVDKWRGQHHTEESKGKIAAANKGRIPWNKGKSQTPETKEKIRKSVLKFIEENGTRDIKNDSPIRQYI